jgi:predicted RNase H-like HicB family nuclease
MTLNVKYFTAYVTYDPEQELYLGDVPTVPGAHTQGSTLDELKNNLVEVLGELVDEEQDEETSYFVGTLQVEIIE